MSRKAEDYAIGDFWLTKRRDGKSPDIWQIATYSPVSRCVVYRSTKRRSVEDAQTVLRSYEADQRSKGSQPTEQAELAPHLFNYLRERGPDVKRLDTIKSSFRAWIGFMMQDAIGTEATVAQITPHIIARFRRWRMAPHTYEVEWGGKTFRNESKGVTAETVQRNIEDLRAALNHAEGENRIIAPKVPSVDKKLRSPPRDTVLTVEQLGAIMGYASDDIGVFRWIALMIATASRPGAALAFNPLEQWQGDTLDLQATGRGLTDKRNAVLPVIAPLEQILTAWAEAPHPPVVGRRTWWRTMRRVLGLPGNVDPYTIRHTVATFMDQEGVPGAELSAIAGHLPTHRGIARTTSRHYLHYNPRNCPKAKRALTKLFVSVEREASKWLADHRRTTPLRGMPIILAEGGAKC